MVVTLLALALVGQADAQVDRDAVLRCGDMVQHLDGSIRDGFGDVFLQATAPPASDADKWFVYVVTMKNCQPCAALKSAWATSEHLRAFAKPDDAKNSWAHFTIYDKDDVSQKWRWAKIKFSGYPTTIIQPPRSGKWGDPSTVVMQRAGFDGNPKKLADAMSAAIRRYADAHRKRSKIEAYTERDEPQEAVVALAGHEQPPIGIDPPWTPPDKEGPFSPSPSPSPSFDIPPDDEGGGLLDSLGFGTVQKMIGFALSLLALMLSLACPVAFIGLCVFAGVKAYRMANTARPAATPTVQSPSTVAPVAPPPMTQERPLAEILAELLSQHAKSADHVAVPRTPIDKLTRDVEGALNEVAAENARVAKLKQVVTGTPEAATNS